jgi:hypothetical protein
MTTQNYLMIQENVVTNVCLWDGDVNSWQPPSDATMLIAETTPAKIWEWNSELKDFVLVESIGVAGIGFKYDGTYCITNESKPELPTPAENQPVTEGTQNL